MNDKANDAVARCVADLVEAGASSVVIAAAVGQTWQRVHAALGPIVGDHGFMMIYARNLQDSTTAFPWLASLDPGKATAIDLSAVRAVFAAQDAQVAGRGALA